MSAPVPGRFTDKVALLTGASSGIGRATTVRLAAEGAKVFAVDLNGEGLESVAEEVTAAGGTIVTRTGSIAANPSTPDPRAKRIRKVSA